MDITALKKNGYTYTYDETVESLIGELPPLDLWQSDQEGVQFPKNVNLSKAHDYIYETYVQDNFIICDFGYSNIWNNTDIPSTVWHNDLPEGSNIFFMYYLNDVSNGGELCFQMDGLETGCIQPKKHLLVLGSQEEHVRHKVNLTKETRIVCNFGFKIQWI